MLGFFLVEHVVMKTARPTWRSGWSCSTKAHDIAFVRHPEPGKAATCPSSSTWEKALRAADLMSMNRISIDIGPTHHGITRGRRSMPSIRSATASETFCGGYDTCTRLQDHHVDLGRGGPGIFYHDRKLNERFLTVVSEDRPAAVPRRSGRGGNPRCQAG